MGPQAIAKYLTYFAFSRIGEAGGRAARDGVGGPLTFFFSSSLCSAFFLSVGLQAIAKYLKYFAFSRIGEAGGRAARDGVGGPLTIFSTNRQMVAFIFDRVGQ